MSTIKIKLKKSRNVSINLFKQIYFEKMVLEYGFSLQNAQIIDNTYVFFSILSYTDCIMFKYKTMREGVGARF